MPTTAAAPRQETTQQGTTQQGTTQQGTWIPTQEAMKFLGIGERMLQINAKKYPDQIRTQQRQQGRSKITLYLLSDLETFRERKAAGMLDATQVPPSAEASTLALQRVVPGQGVQGPAEFWKALAERVAPTKPKLFVSLRKAAEISGLPERWLHQQVKDGKLGRDVGVPGGRPHIVIGVGELEALSQGRK